MVVYGEKTSQRPFYGEIIENLSRSTLRKRSKKYNGSFMEKRHLTCLLLEREDLYKAFPRLLKGNPCKFFLERIYVTVLFLEKRTFIGLLWRAES